MKITLVSQESIRLESAPGPLTIEASAPHVVYSPFHMLASGLATCTFSVLYSWATHAGIPAEDLVLDVGWSFAEEPHRVGAIDVTFSWPSLPPERRIAAERAAELCAVHATLTHPPAITISGPRG